MKNLLGCALLVACLPLLAGCDALAKGAKGAANQAANRAVNSANDAIADETRRQSEKVIETAGDVAAKKITTVGEEPKEKTEEEKKAEAEKKEAEGK